VDLSRQVVSLGCGFDTTYFQLKAQGKAPTRYIELDYHEVRCQPAP
jgi:tRNA wybutosine-synthesizing protein 4